MVSISYNRNILHVQQNNATWCHSYFSDLEKSMIFAHKGFHSQTSASLFKIHESHRMPGTFRKKNLICHAKNKKSAPEKWCSRYKTMEDCLQRISLHNPPQYISNRSSRTLESCKSYDEKTWPSTCPKEVLFGTKIVNELIKCVSDMDWFSRVNLGTHSHHYSFLASTLKLDSSQQGARWEIVQQRQRNAPRSLSVLDGRPELLKPRDALYKSERERESCPNRKNLQHYDPNTLLSVSTNSHRLLFSCMQS